jgi:16S rRNA processing protein RimM
MSKKIIVAKVLSAFGIKGEIKIISYCQPPQKVEKYPLFDKSGNALKLKISNKNKTVTGYTQSGDAILIAKINGIDDRNQAEALGGSEIFAERSSFASLKKNEFYYTDLIGLNVVDADSKLVGKIINVANFGAGTVLEVEFTDPRARASTDKIESLPFKDAIFPEVNLEENFIRIEFPEILQMPNSKQD